MSGSVRRVLLLGGMALWFVVLGIFASATLRRLGLSGSAATGVGGFVTLSMLALLLLSARRVRGAYSETAGRQWDLAALSAAPGALVAAVLWIAVFPGGAIAAAAIACVVFAGLVGWHRRGIAREMRKQVRRPMRVGDIHQAERMIRDCREALSETDLVGEQRTAVELNLAQALTERSALSGQDDGLPAAVKLIERVVDQPDADDALLLYAASSLVTAMDLKAERSGDLTGYEEALELQMRIAERGSVDAGLPRALVNRAEYLQLRMARPRDESDAARFEEYREAAVADLRRALDMTPTRSVMHLELVSKLALFGTLWNPGSSDIDAAIGQCRRALRWARHRPFGDRVIGYQALSWLLSERAERDPSRRAADLAEAERLCRMMLARGGELVAPGASEFLAQVLSRQDLMRREGA